MLHKPQLSAWDMQVLHCKLQGRQLWEILRYPAGQVTTQFLSKFNTKPDLHAVQEVLAQFKQLTYISEHGLHEYVKLFVVEGRFNEFKTEIKPVWQDNTQLLSYNE